MLSTRRCQDPPRICLAHVSQGSSSITKTSSKGWDITLSRSRYFESVDKTAPEHDRHLQATNRRWPRGVPCVRAFYGCPVSLNQFVFTHEKFPYIDLLNASHIRFLEEYGDTPFINRLESRASIAYACICQLHQGLDFLEPLSTSTSAIGVASGFFALWPYSHGYWIEHLLDCFEANHETTSESIRAVVDRAKLLCLRIMELDAREPLGDGPCLHNPSQDMRFSNFLAVVDPTVSRFVTELHKAPDDEAPLARAIRRYQEIIESLIRGSDVGGISPESLLEFKEVYGPIAFVCNVYGCERAVFGFPSKDELKNHQALHLESFRCYEKNCVYNDVGFPTARSLRDHNRKRHGTARLRPIPKRLRRVGKLSRDMEDDDIDDPGDEGDWSCIYNSQVRRKLQVNLCQVIQRTSVVNCVRFSPDGERIAVANYKLVSVFDTYTGILLQDLDHALDKDEADEIFVQAVCFSPDGKDLATGGDDGLLRVRGSVCLPQAHEITQVPDLEH